MKEAVSKPMETEERDVSGQRGVILHGSCCAMVTPGIACAGVSIFPLDRIGLFQRHLEISRQSQSAALPAYVSDGPMQLHSVTF